MALKGDREVWATNIDYTIATGQNAERGIVLIAHTTAGQATKPNSAPTVQGGTGSAGGGLGTVGTTGNDSRPVGLLLDDVENLDFTVTPQIHVRNVVPRGSEVSLLTKGWVKTNLIEAGRTPAAGERAYLAASGYLSNREHVTSSGIICGYWRGAKDADGYAKVEIDIQGGPRPV
jgi:hypothetical protein